MRPFPPPLPMLNRRSAPARQTGANIVNQSRHDGQHPLSPDGRASVGHGTGSRISAGEIGAKTGGWCGDMGEDSCEGGWRAVSSNKRRWRSTRDDVSPEQTPPRCGTRQVACQTGVAHERHMTTMTCCH